MKNITLVFTFIFLLISVNGICDKNYLVADSLELISKVKQDSLLLDTHESSKENLSDTAGYSQLLFFVILILGAVFVVRKFK